MRWKIGLLGWLLMMVSTLHAATISDIRYNRINNKVQLVIDMDQPPIFNQLSLANPPRIVLDFANTNRLSRPSLLINQGAVRGVRSGKRGADLRLVVDLNAAAKANIYTMTPDAQGRGNRVVLDIYDPSADSGISLTSVNEAMPMVIFAGASLEDQAGYRPMPPVSQPATTSVAPNNMTTTLPTRIAGTANQAPVTNFNTPSVTSNSAMPPVTNFNTPAVTSNSAMPPVTNFNTPAVTSNSVMPPVTNFNTSAVPATTVTPPVTTTTGNLFSSVTKPSTPQMTTTTTRKPARRSSRAIVVCIDPGHGGKDPGANYPALGAWEKNVVLEISKRLRSLLNMRTGYKVVMTRDRDVFIPLFDRPKKCRAAGGDLFVSIHADAVESREPSGASVYILSTHGASSQLAKYLANSENAVDLKWGVDVSKYDNDIQEALLNIQQEATLESSNILAGKTLNELSRVGNIHKNRVERANFVVLRSPEIPSMLVETGFISNPMEAKRLMDPVYQQQIAQGIAAGIDKYFQEHLPQHMLLEQ